MLSAILKSGARLGADGAETCRRRVPRSDDGFRLLPSLHRSFSQFAEEAGRVRNIEESFSRKENLEIDDVRAVHTEL